MGALPTVDRQGYAGLSFPLTACKNFSSATALQSTVRLALSSRPMSPSESGDTRQSNGTCAASLAPFD